VQCSAVLHPTATRVRMIVTMRVCVGVQAMWPREADPTPDATLQRRYAPVPASSFRRRADRQLWRATPVFACGGVELLPITAYCHRGGRVGNERRVRGCVAGTGSAVLLSACGLPVITCTHVLIVSRYERQLAKVLCTLDSDEARSKVIQTLQSSWSRWAAIFRHGDGGGADEAYGHW